MTGSSPALRPVRTEQGALVHTAAERRLAAEHWLLSAHPQPAHARAEWQANGVVLLPLGTLFSAIRIPGRLVQAVAASTKPEDIDAVLDEVLDRGPVICDPRGPRYYALVPASVPRTWAPAVDDWKVADVDCLDRGTYLGVPRLDAVQPRSGTATYWSVPMPSAGVVCSPLKVARLIAAGVRHLSEDLAPWPADPPLALHGDDEEAPAPSSRTP
ncbi:hypothetical protein ACH49_19715 [Streptomyces leeuwenhoekii]|uniref:DNA primase/polymerase bifunctional N-terminal domain-containing protein n=1 Tax=Streptomyces leeuwenhoekii TaxID=1437453 RepID=A0ABR5HVU3_STRLW|nr:hypothetical protein [Streptomyces leeuwenhoekii]KMS77715.1 hypothetical protein ACH49_19715 [Streptomyces leeuwenhoekii]